MALGRKKTKLAVVLFLLLGASLIAYLVGSACKSIKEEEQTFPVGAFEVHAFLEQHNGG